MRNHKKSKERKDRRDYEEFNARNNQKHNSKRYDKRNELFENDDTDPFNFGLPVSETWH